MSEREEDDVLPRFFKVFLSGKSSELMELPKSFNEHLQDPLPQTAKLQGIGGGVWSVSFKKIGDYAYFTSGWSKFAEDHELKDGEFLTFVYDGSHTFEVSVFGLSGCKEIRAVVETVNLSDSNSDKKTKKKTMMKSARVSTLLTVKTPRLMLKLLQGFPIWRLSLIHAFLPSSRKIYMSWQSIPANVVKEYGLTFCDRIKYIDGEGITHGDRKRSGRGIVFKRWDRICRRNRLKEYDTVHCEMFHIRNKVHSIKITTTRG